MLLSKGFEVEMYTGTPEGEVVGLSDRIVADLEGFVREPDSRNVEYTTAPLCSYDRLLCALVKPRVRLREYLKQLGDYTLLPGSTLSLGGSDRFYRSDPNNPYHTYIEQTYGTKVVTASIHINIGISQPELLMRAIRLARVEAPLYLALSASSPFLDGEVTGYHSTRWGLFPKTPAIVPLFESHRHYIQWTEEQLELGTMQNVRHLWSAVRPNGDRPLLSQPPRTENLRPGSQSSGFVGHHCLTRSSHLADDGRPQLRPVRTASTLPAATRNEDLVALTDANELAASGQSLDAELTHWQDGRTILARDWIEEIYREVWPIAKKRGFSCFLSPLKKILREGNTAQQWLKLHEGGSDTRSIILQGINGMAHQEWELEDNLCAQLVA